MGNHKNPLNKPYTIMKFLQVASIFLLALFIGCGGGETDEQQQAESAETDDIRTIEIIGVDDMKFVVESGSEGISVGDPVRDDLLLLESITVSPGEEIRIRLTTRSKLPGSAMAHNWLLLQQDVDAKAFADEAGRAKENDYVPEGRDEDIIAQTGMAAGGETTEVTFTVPEETGTYEYICTFPGHFIANMRGDFIIQESGGM